MLAAAMLNRPAQSGPVNTTRPPHKPIPVWRPPIPKEHGAWALLYGPFVITLLAFGRADWRTPLFLLALTSLFLAHEPLSRLARPSSASTAPARQAYWHRWIMLEMAATLASGSLLIWLYELWILPLIGLIAAVPYLIHLRLVSRRQERLVAGELLGILGLTAAGAPATYYVMQQRLDSTAWLLLLVNFLYFSSAVFYVKMRVSPFSRKEDERQRRRQCLIFHLFLLASVTALVAAKLSHPLILLAFAPILIRAFWGLSQRGGRLNLKRIGYGEVAFTVLFVVFSVWAWRAG